MCLQRAGDQNQKPVFLKLNDKINDKSTLDGGGEDTDNKQRKTRDREKGKEKSGKNCTSQWYPTIAT